MKKFCAVILLVVAACSGSQLSEEQKATAMWEMVHYIAKLAPGATHETKFEAQYDEYYRSVMADYRWMHIQPNPEGGYYFFVSRPARSLTPMMEGIGGKFEMNKDTLTTYDEVFRMWKMPEADLTVRGKAMFDRMVDGKDLSMYYPKFAGDKYIEFPDDNYYFDKAARTWRSSN